MKEEEEEKKILATIESESSTPSRFPIEIELICSSQTKFATASRAKQPNKRPPTRKHIQTMTFTQAKEISKQVGDEKMTKSVSSKMLSDDFFKELDVVSKSLDAAIKRREDEKKIIEQEERMRYIKIMKDFLIFREDKERRRRDSEASQNLLVCNLQVIIG